MQWLLQNNLIHQPDYDALNAALQTAQLPTHSVKILPFIHTTEPQLNLAGSKVIIFGSLKCQIAAKHYGWQPGVYYNDNFELPLWLEKYGKNCLNADVTLGKFGMINPALGSFFIRPISDQKEFAARVVTHDEYWAWRKQVWRYGDAANPQLSVTTKVAYAPVQEIINEYRTFVVDGKVVAASTYKLHQRHLAVQYMLGPVWDFAQHMARIWQPAKAFTLDVALCETGYKIIEIGCINCSGLYAADAAAIINAINQMEAG